MKQITFPGIKASIDYLIAYGVCNSIGDLLYKQLENGNYVVVWKSCRDVDVFLCKHLPRSHEGIESNIVTRKILSFDCNNAMKVEDFKENILGITPT